MGKQPNDKPEHVDRRGDEIHSLIDSIITERKLDVSQVQEVSDALRFYTVLRQDLLREIRQNDGAQLADSTVRKIRETGELQLEIRQSIDSALSRLLRWVLAAGGIVTTVLGIVGYNVISTSIDREVEVAASREAGEQDARLDQRIDEFEDEFQSVRNQILSDFKERSEAEQEHLERISIQHASLLKELAEFSIQSIREEVGIARASARSARTEAVEQIHSDVRRAQVGFQESMRESARQFDLEAQNTLENAHQSVLNGIEQLEAKANDVDRGMSAQIALITESRDDALERIKSSSLRVMSQLQEFNKPIRSFNQQADASLGQAHDAGQDVDFFLQFMDKIQKRDFSDWKNFGVTVKDSGESSTVLRQVFGAIQSSPDEFTDDDLEWVSASIEEVGIPNIDEYSELLATLVASVVARNQKVFDNMKGKVREHIVFSVTDTSFEEFVIAVGEGADRETILSRYEQVDLSVLTVMGIANLLRVADDVNLSDVEVADAQRRFLRMAREEEWFASARYPEACAFVDAATTIGDTDPQIRGDRDRLLRAMRENLTGQGADPWGAIAKINRVIGEPESEPEPQPGQE